MASQQYVLDGRFELGDLTERRPTGDFYTGTDKTTGQKVHVFIAQPASFPTPQITERAKREISVIAGLNHPGIIQYLHINILPDGRLFYVTPVPSGTKLSDRITKGVIPPDEAIEIMASLVDSLNKAAKAGVFHRNLSPSSILLSGGGKTQLMDFGLSQFLGGNIYGDPWFMSPEQAAGQDPGMNSTVYSLGAIFYYMVAGLPLFTDSDPQVLIKKHTSEMPVMPSKARPELKLPAELDTVLAKALAKAPASRYPNIDELFSECRRVFGMSPQNQPAPASAASPAPAAASPAPAAASPAPAAASPAPAAAEQQKRAPRRRRKGGFRETLWFKKGEEQVEEGPVKAKDLLKVEKGTGDISDSEKSLEEKYRDGSVDLTSDDRRKFSVRTGQTGVFQAVKVEDIKAAEKKREVAEQIASKKRKQKSLILSIVAVIIIAIGVVAGIFVYNKMFYKKLFNAKAIAALETELKNIKPPPPPKYLLSTDKKVDVLVKESEKAMKNHALIPDTSVGQGTSAVEYILSLRKVKKDHKDLNRLIKEFIGYALSREYMDIHGKDIKFLARLAESMAKLNENNPYVSAFKDLVAFYQTRKGKKSKIKIESYWKNLPYYPPHTGWAVPASNSSKKLFKKLKKLMRVKNLEKLITPTKNCALSYYMKLDAVLKAEKKPSKRMLKQMVKIKKDFITKLHKLSEEYIKKSDWKNLEIAIKAIMIIDRTDKKNFETLQKYKKHFPAKTLSKVSLLKFKPPVK